MHFSLRSEEVRAHIRRHERFGLHNTSRVDDWKVLPLLRLHLNQILRDLLLEVQMIIKGLYFLVEVTLHVDSQVRLRHLIHVRVVPIYRGLRELAERTRAHQLVLVQLD